MCACTHLKIILSIKSFLFDILCLIIALYTNISYDRAQLLPTVFSSITSSLQSKCAFHQSSFYRLLRLLVPDITDIP
ncbi:hypothetical protein Hanom_Chr10g00903811 [Helianthus anomalus]